MLRLTPLGQKILLRSGVILASILLALLLGVAVVLWVFGPSRDGGGASPSGFRSYSIDLAGDAGTVSLTKPLDGAGSSSVPGLRDYPKERSGGVTGADLTPAQRSSAEIVNAPLNRGAAKNPEARAVPSYLTDRSPLPPAPDSGVTRASELGPQPMIGLDGRKPWMVYAKPFSLKTTVAATVSRSDTPPPTLVGVVVGFLGPSTEASDSAIAKLPGNVTLAIDPYDDQADWWLAKARANGHESLLGVPMEPNDYPRSDPGAAALLSSLSESDNELRLEWLLGRGSGFVGIVNMSGEKFLSQPRVLIPLLKQMSARGLLLVANGFDQSSSVTTDGILTSPKLRRVGRLARDVGVPRAMVDIRITGGMSTEEVKLRLLAAEKIAASVGQTVVMVERPTIEILTLLAEWTIGFEETRIRLAPISALVDRQTDKPVVSLESLRKSSGR
ncbi:MAG: divergent polysaccharide deacetylase family protein [Alphaproteobacteria bacterium]|nr:divergent polysaccharide deacetylase family protein [Alphaproteobacteria bacterium]